MVMINISKTRLAILVIWLVLFSLAELQWQKSINPKWSATNLGAHPRGQRSLWSKRVRAAQKRSSDTEIQICGSRSLILSAANPSVPATSAALQNQNWPLDIGRAKIGEPMSLVKNMNKRKKAGTSRSKKDSTVSPKAYKDMKAGWPKKGKKKWAKTGLHAWRTSLISCPKR